MLQNIHNLSMEKKNFIERHSKKRKRSCSEIILMLGRCQSSPNWSMNST